MIEEEMLHLVLPEILHPLLDLTVQHIVQLINLGIFLQHLLAQRSPQGLSLLDVLK